MCFSEEERKKTKSFRIVRFATFCVEKCILPAEEREEKKEKRKKKKRREKSKVGVEIAS